MVKIEVNMGTGKVTIDAEGHANYAPRGEDIVCSAISAILQTAVLGLQGVAEQYPNHVSVNIKGATEAP